jgi:hypothetical protein
MKTFYNLLVLTIVLCAVQGSAGYEINVSGLMGGAAAYQGMDDHPDSPWYKSFSFQNPQDKTVILLKVQPFQQTSEFSCGAAAALINLRYYGKDGDEMKISSEMGAVPVYGADVGEMSKWFSDRGWIVNSSNSAGPGDLTVLQENLKAGRPVLVAWADWGGHWMVVIGYDTMGTEDMVDDVIIFADPYDVTDHKQDGYYTFPAARFYALWFLPHWFPDTDAVRPWLTASPGPLTE